MFDQYLKGCDLDFALLSTPYLMGMLHLASQGIAFPAGSMLDPKNGGGRGGIKYIIASKTKIDAIPDEGVRNLALEAYGLAIKIDEKNYSPDTLPLMEEFHSKIKALRSHFV